MRYKNIVLVGASSITTLCLFFGLMYYLNQDDIKCPIGTFLCQNSTTCVLERSRCNGKWDCPYGDDESLDNCDRCSDFTFSCKNSIMCVSYRMKCDGIRHCPYGDDEENCVDTHENDEWIFEEQIFIDQLGIYKNWKFEELNTYKDWKLENESDTEINCDISDAPDTCFCGIYHVRCMNQTDMPHNLSPNITKIDLKNNKVSKILLGQLSGLHNLKVLRLDNNKIVKADFSDLENSTTLFHINLSTNVLTTLKLPQLPALTLLELNENRLESITKDLFAGCPALKFLNMGKNNISYIDENAFQNLKQLQMLWLYTNMLTTLKLPQLPALTVLALYNNRLESITEDLFAECPALEFLNIGKNNISYIDENAFQNLEQLQMLWLYTNMLTTLKLPQLPALTKLVLYNNRLESITKDLFAGCPALELLYMNNNNISYIDENAFQNLQQLQMLYLDRNMLTTLKLPQLPALILLALSENRLESITKNLFAGYPTLLALYIEKNNISYIDEIAFQNLKELRTLSIGYNPVKELPKALFNSLDKLEFLYLEDINIDHLDINTFEILTNLRYIGFTKFRYCTTYASHVKNCSPSSDGVSSLFRLLSKPLLRTAVWSISFVTCLSNILVLWERSQDENRVLSIIIRNLAVSDMLMGIYLIVIGIEDIRFRDNYKEQASTWMSSWSCTLSGALAMTSSEVSLLIMSFMSVERFIVIAAPLQRHRAIKSKAAILSMIIIWIVGLILALIPVIYWKNTSTRFYGHNGMCFPLHIDDPYITGWKYSAFIFLGVNFLGLIIIGYVYAAMFVSIWKTRRVIPLSVGDSEIALRFFLIVLTDAACWVPIIALKMLALTEHPVPSHIHAWVVIFILPINSAINPLLYTFTTPKFCERFNESRFGKLCSYILRKCTGQASQALATNNIEMAINVNARQSNEGEI